MSDASYTQVTGKLDCNKCVWGTRDGGCASWECEFIDRDDAVKAWRNMPSAEPEERTKERTETHACDCISRQAAIDAPVKMVSEGLDWIPVYHLKDLPSAEPDPEWRKKHYEIAYNQGYVDACKYYENLPERKKGKWIDKSGGIEDAWNYCSVCGEQAIDLYDFCPNCGADMRGTGDNSDE